MMFEKVGMERRKGKESEEASCLVVANLFLHRCSELVASVIYRFELSEEEPQDRRLVGELQALH